MCQIAEVLTFAALSVAKCQNVQCSWDFLEVSQEAKVVTFISAWPLCVIAMLFGHSRVSKKCRNKQLSSAYCVLFSYFPKFTQSGISPQ